jgi:hypothetical protein
LATITNLQVEWCNGINIQYAWVRGHADSLDRETTREERENITADEVCDIIRETATGRDGARANFGLYPVERCALFIKGTEITSNWKECLTQQLLDGDLREQHTKIGTETNVKGKTDGYRETSAQPCVHRSKTHTVVRRKERVLIMQQPVRGLEACDIMSINRC